MTIQQEMNGDVTTVVTKSPINSEPADKPANCESNNDDSRDLGFSRSDIDALGNLVRMVDKDEESGLELFCYVNCSNSDSNTLKRCRGVVFNKDKLVMQAFPYTSDYNHTQVDTLKKHISDPSLCSFYDAYEGALIRMFNHEGRWFLSTHRKLNAFKSKWASRESFGTLFKKALTHEVSVNEKLSDACGQGDTVMERFQCSLDPDKQYMFLVCNNKDNRIVCLAGDTPKLYHVGTFVDGALTLEEDVYIPKPDRHTFQTVEELTDYVYSMDVKYKQGVICFLPDGGQLKIFNKEYQDLFQVRGNEPSIKFRYLQVRMSRRMTNMLYYLYPDKVKLFDEYENTLYDIARSIYRAYVQRFIKKRYVTVPREEYAVIKLCHSWHLSDRTNNRITLDRVIKVLNEQTPTHLNHMIRRFKTEQVRQNEQISLRLRSNSTNSATSRTPRTTPLPSGVGVKTPTPSPLILGVNGVPRIDPPVVEV